MGNFKILDTIAVAMFLFGILIASFNEVSYQEQHVNSISAVSPQQDHLVDQLH